MPTSESRKRANAKYNAKTYKNITVSAKFADYDMFAEYCEKNNISISKLFQNSAKYCINNNIDIADYKENK